MKFINIFLFINLCNAYSIITKIITNQNAINLLTAYEMRLSKYEEYNNIKRNNAQKFIKKMHQKAFDDINDDKVVVNVLCSVRRNYSLDEPTYLIQHLGSFSSITPMWNLYYSDIYGLIKPIDALDKCKKYYLPYNILNERDINMIHKLSRIIKCERFLD